MKEIKIDLLADLNNMSIVYGLLKENGIKLFLDQADSIEKNLNGNPFNADVDLTDYKNFINQKMPYYLRNTIFLLYFSGLEEVISILYLSENSEENKLDNGYGILRFKTYIKEKYSGDLSTFKEYQTISEFQRVRNALLHAGGRVDLAKDKKIINDFVKKYKSYFSIENGKLLISEQGVNVLKDTIVNFLKALEV